MMIDWVEGILVYFILIYASLLKRVDLIMNDDNDETLPPIGENQPLTVEQAIANLTSPDHSDRYYAAWWLGKHSLRHS
jgi:hypothetical protein